MGHPGVALRDLEASRDALSRGRYQPQPTERRLSCSHRVTFLTGANRDFPNWRRHEMSPPQLSRLRIQPHLRATAGQHFNQSIEIILTFVERFHENPFVLSVCPDVVDITREPGVAIRRNAGVS